MGKRVLVQRRGKGGSQFRAAKVGKIAPAKYPNLPQNETVEAEVLDIVHERGRSAPLMKIGIGGRVYYLPAVRGVCVGQTIKIGPEAEPVVGNVLPIYRIPDGAMISNIELTYGDGGKLVRSSGGHAILFSHFRNGDALIKLPSGKSMTVKARCRAMIGEVAGGGRTEKPFLKAGAKLKLMRARGRKYPRVRGVAMAAAFHPFGGAYKKKKLKTVARTAPPGQKVGAIAAKRTGKKKR